MHEDGYVPINFVPESFHKVIQSVAVLFDDGISFRDNVFLKFHPYDNSIRLMYEVR
jgi:hypothetical protein